MLTDGLQASPRRTLRLFRNSRMGRELAPRALFIVTNMKLMYAEELPKHWIACAIASGKLVFKHNQSQAGHNLRPEQFS